MKKRVSDKFWFPWWPDKWIFGSVRIECTPAERGIWVDLLSLASKDDGHIRANEEIPYPLQQLAGMLIIPEEELDAAIKKFLEKGKLTKTKTGTLYVTKWEKYQFSESYHRVQKHREKEFESRCGNGKLLQCNDEALPYNNKEYNNKLNNNKEEPYILNLLSKVKGYPFNEKKDLEFISGLKADFPDLDALEEVKKKCAWWLGKPLLKKSNPHLQLRNWFLKAREFLKEGDKERKVGQSYEKEPSLIPMRIWTEAYGLLDRKKWKSTSDFYDKVKSVFPQIKPQWEQSDKTPETFIRLVEGV